MWKGKQMEKEFITYEQALDLKELGFDPFMKENCLAYFNTSNSNNDLETKDWWCLPKNDFQYALSAPLKQQVFRWFREKYGYWSYIKEATKGTCRFNIEKFDEKFFNSGLFGSYEDAESACIDKLIEMVKKK